MKTLLKWLGVALAVVVVAAAALLAWASSKTDAAMARTHDRPSIDIGQAVRAAPLSLGERIVQVRNGCTHCHGKNLSGAMVVDNPFFGSVYGSNLTPAGLRDWSDEDIAVAVHVGIGRDGRALVMMPSHDFQHLASDDLAAVIAYLRSVPALERPNPPIRVGPGARVLYALGKLPTLLPAETLDVARGFVAKPAEAASVEFGRYFATSACTGCHGPELRGGRIPGGPPEWAAASSLRLGADSRWTQEGFARAMRTGRSGLDGHALRPPMPVETMSQLTETELGALWQYLATLR